MEKFFEEIQSGYWWIGVVLVGITINLISSYFQIRLDKILSSVSKKWRKRVEDRKEQEQQLVNDFIEDNSKFTLYVGSEGRLRLQSIYICVFSLTFFLLINFYLNASIEGDPKWIVGLLLISGFTYLIYSLILFMRANNMQKNHRKVREKDI